MAARTHKDARRSYLVRKYGPDGDRHHVRSWLDTDATIIPAARAEEVARTLIVEPAQEIRRAKKSEGATSKDTVFGGFTAIRTYRGRRNFRAASRGRYRVRALIHAWA